MPVRRRFAPSELAVADGRWKLIERQRLSRSQFQRFFHNRTPCTVVMEACGTAHFWGRELTRLGFTVRLLPAQYVRAYRRRNKNDRANAAALIEAARCAEILEVPVNSEHQQAIQGLHRIRRLGGMDASERLRRSSSAGMGCLISIHPPAIAQRQEIIMA